MRAAEIAAELGRAYRSGQWWRCRCPVHDSRGATLALRDSGRGFIAVCHAGCLRVEILAELRRRGLIDGYIQQPTPSPRAARDNDPRRNAVARWVWDRAREARSGSAIGSLSCCPRYHRAHAALTALDALAAPHRRQLRPGDGRARRRCRRASDRGSPDVARSGRGWDLAAARPCLPWTRRWRRGAACLGGRDADGCRGRRDGSLGDAGHRNARLGGAQHVRSGRAGAAARRPDRDHPRRPRYLQSRREGCEDSSGTVAGRGPAGTDRDPAGARDRFQRCSARSGVRPHNRGGPCRQLMVSPRFGSLSTWPRR